jgi:hypothetical protein
MKRTKLARAVLATIQDEESFSDIVEEGWDYVQILDEVARLQKAGLVVREGSQIRITPSGTRALGEMNLRQLPRPRKTVRVEKLAPSDLYLPLRDALEDIKSAISTTDVSRRGGESPS